MIFKLNFHKLNTYQQVKVSGLDAQKYLQGQLTLDVEVLTNQRHRLAAHCDAKGKVWGVLRFWSVNQEEYHYLIPANLVDKQLVELKKYAVFSKVEFTLIDTSVMTALFFDESTALNRFIELNGLNNPSDEVKQTENALAGRILVNSDRELSLLILEDGLTCLLNSTKNIDAIMTETTLSEFDMNPVNESYWLANVIKRGEALITDETTQQFIPQALNLQALDAISFTKGCYTGQEMVARAKYRGANKRALFCLNGQTKEKITIGDAIEMQLGDNWRETGTILCYANVNDSTWIQIILNNDLDKNTNFRLPGDNTSHFSIYPLPYELTD